MIAAGPLIMRPVSASQLRSLLETVARVVSRRWDLRVVLQGDQAYTDGGVIVLPVLEDVAVLHGLLDHELAHVLHSEFLEIDDPDEKHLLDALEDARIEPLLVAEWPGVARNLRAALDHYLADLARRASEVTSWRKLGVALSLDQRGLGEHPLLAPCLVDDPCASSLIQAAQPILRAMPATTCTTTRDVHRVVQAILERTRPLTQARPPLGTPALRPVPIRGARR